MPIKFRCPHCRQFLGISRSRAGALADCPTCGRTIRIPHLDGRVDPLPSPELDLEDQQLKKALAALAGIDEDGSSDAGVSSGLAAAAAPHASREEAVAQADRSEARHVPVAPPPQEVVPSAAADPKPAVTPERSSKGAVPPGDPLERLAKLADADGGEKQPSPEKGQRPRSSSPAPVALPPAVPVRRLVAGGIALFVLGLVVGRLTAPTATIVAESNPAENAAAAAVQVDQPEREADREPDDRKVALTGRITYLTPDGQSRPDEGARVLVLPEERPGSARLPVVGFRADAAEVDVRLARAALRELGGDFAIADASGHYEIHLPAAGTYDVLMISRYQPRDSDLPLTDSVQALLPVWFDRPSQLIGQVQYRLSSLLYQGEVPATRDCTFERL